MLTKKDKEFLKNTFVTNAHFKETIQEILKPIEKSLSNVETELTKLRKAEETASKYFDTVTTSHTSRLKKIEKHLGFPDSLN